MFLENNTTILWAGWSTTLDALLRNGWEYKYYYPYRSAYPMNSRGSLGGRHIVDCSRERVVLRHRAKGVVATLRKSPHAPLADCYEVDALVHHKQVKVRPLSIMLAQEASREDIPGLFDLILELQKGYPKTPANQLSQAEIIEMHREGQTA